MTLRGDGLELDICVTDLSMVEALRAGDISAMPDAADRLEDYAARLQALATALDDGKSPTAALAAAGFSKPTGRKKKARPRDLLHTYRALTREGPAIALFPNRPPVARPVAPEAALAILVDRFGYANKRKAYDALQAECARHRKAPKELWGLFGCDLTLPAKPI